MLNVIKFNMTLFFHNGAKIFFLFKFCQLWRVIAPHHLYIKTDIYFILYVLLNPL